MEKVIKWLSYKNAGVPWKGWVQGKGNQRFASSGVPSIKMADGSIKWDGQLNFYRDGEADIAQMDSEQGKVLDYRELEEVIETAVEAGKDTIMLGGKEVSVARLMQISETDRMIIASGKNPDGSYTSKAAEALFEDGYMSYEEARISQQEVMNRYNSYDYIKSNFKERIC